MNGADFTNLHFGVIRSKMARLLFGNEKDSDGMALKSIVNLFFCLFDPD
jgi:hypothetical protein